VVGQGWVAGEYRSVEIGPNDAICECALVAALAAFAGAVADSLDDPSQGVYVGSEGRGTSVVFESA
jgi:hypothetical protein